MFIKYHQYSIFVTFGTIMCKNTIQWLEIKKIWSHCKSKIPHFRSIYHLNSFTNSKGNDECYLHQDKSRNIKQFSLITPITAWYYKNSNKLEMEKALPSCCNWCIVDFLGVSIIHELSSLSCPLPWIFPYCINSPTIISPKKKKGKFSMKYRNLATLKNDQHKYQNHSHG